MVLYEDTIDSVLAIDPSEDRAVIMTDDSVYKVYTYQSFVEDQRNQFEFYNEYVVTKKAQ